MTIKEAFMFHKFDRNLLPSTIDRAANGLVEPEFLKGCTIRIAASLDIQVDDLVTPYLRVEGVGNFVGRRIVVTDEHVTGGIVWDHFWNATAESGAVVTTDYTVKKADGSALSSPLNQYKVK